LFQAYPGALSRARDFISDVVKDHSRTVLFVLRAAARMGAKEETTFSAQLDPVSSTSSATSALS